MTQPAVGRENDFSPGDGARPDDGAPALAVDAAARTGAAADTDDTDADADTDTDTGADRVMSVAAAGAALPTALSFARQAMRMLVRGRWRLEKVRIALDAEGRGEVLYRLHGAGHVFHFFLVSDKLPEQLKTDRNFAPGWDAMGVLCEGAWTPEREATLRREVPKQRAGFADYDTLVYARGNRSARLFESVIAALAAGRQPDPRRIAPVGYVLRTTAFIANGQLGTRPLAGYPPDHPLARPYRAPFVAAFALREFVFDLVDHLARVRNPAAPRLAPDFRRFLGIGNSAATGLVQYVANHPRQLQGWIGARQQALAAARARPLPPQSPQARQALALLDRAIRHAEEGRQDADGVFAGPAQSLGELRRVRDRFVASPSVARLPAGESLSPETRAVLDAIALELHADLIDAAERAFDVDECLDVDPAMTVGALAAIVARDGRWALAGADDPATERHFWYRATATPRDVRRGLRGRLPAAEHETTLETARLLRRLAAALAGREPGESLARLLFDRPDLRQVAARACALAGAPYAEVRTNPLAPDFSPFEPIRLLLALFGLEKFEAAPPKSVRGTFLQGAPIAEDVAAGRDGTWPFPPMPAADATADASDDVLDPPPPGLGVAIPAVDHGEPQRDDPRVSRCIAPGELARMLRLALQAHGASAGDADVASRIALLAALLRGTDGGEQVASALLSDAAGGRIPRRPTCRRIAVGALASARQRAAALPGLTGVVGRCDVIDAGGGAAWALAASACDLAVASALDASDGLGAVLVTDVASAAWIGPLVWRAARSGLRALALWSEPDVRGRPLAGYAAAGPAAEGRWFACADLPQGLDRFAERCGTAGPIAGDGSPIAVAVAEAGRAGLLASGRVLLVCEHSAATRETRDARTAVVARDPLAAVLATIDPDGRQWSGGGFDAWVRVADRQGVVLSRDAFERLDAAGRGLLLPDADEPSVLPPGADPVKVF